MRARNDTRRSPLTRPVATGLALAVLGAALTGAIATSLHACSVYDPSLLESTSPLTPVDGGPGVDAEAGVVDGCEHTRWPNRPAFDTPGKTATDTFAGALRRVNVSGTSDAGVQVSGADLDNSCTCSTQAGSCTPRSAKDVCDDIEGRDNSAGDLFRTLATRTNSADIFSEKSLNTRLELGQAGMLLEIRDYNGAADDMKVFVALYPSNGVVNADDASTASGTATWDGNDVWTRDPDGLLGGATVPNSNVAIPKYVDENAYVAGGVLVATLDFPIVLGASSNGNVAVDLAGGRLFGKLVRDGGGYRVEGGQIVGRWPTNKLLPVLSMYSDPLFPSMKLCGESPTYQTLKTLICNAVDVTRDPSKDNAGASCDAVSIAIGFTSYPAQLGPAKTRPADVLGCPGADGGAWTDDCTK